MVLKGKAHHSRLQHAKFTVHDWGNIETKLDAFGLLVLTTLAPLGAAGLKVGGGGGGGKAKTKKKKGKQEEVAEDKSTSFGLLVCGDTIYRDVIRPKLQAEDLVIGDLIVKEETDSGGAGKKKKKGGKKGKKQGKTAEEIRFDNTLKKTSEAVDDLLKTVKRFNRPTYGFSSQFVELRLATLMYCAHRAYNSTDKTTYRSSIYNVIVGMLKALHVTQNVPDIAATTLEDVQKWIDFLSEKIKFSTKRVFYSYPRLILATDYDQVFPTMAVKPYSSQVELMDYVKKYSTSLIFYNAMIGAGKTTSVVPLAYFCRALRLNERAEASKEGTIKKGRIFKQLIFCCSVEPVRYQVATLAYNAEIPFGIATYEEKYKTVRIRNNFSCPAAENRELIVADLLATWHLLNASQDYILFIDEPTVAADIRDDPLSKMVIDILEVAPSRTILSSATMPHPDEIPEVVGLFQSRHPKADVVSMQSREALIGCQVITKDGTTLSPHTNCTTVEELAKVIKVIEMNAFLGRLYTAPIVYRLKERLEDLGVPGLPDLEKTFEDVNNLSQVYIQDTARDLLNQLLETKDDEIIFKACSPIDATVDDEDSEGEFNWDDDDDEQELLAEEDPEATGFGFEDAVAPEELDELLSLDLATTNAWKFMGGCLVAVNDPMSAAMLLAKQLFANYTTFGRALKHYDVAQTKWKATIDKVTNSIKNQDMLSQRLQQMEEEQKPRIAFPAHLQLNTKEHVRHFVSKEEQSQVDKRYLRTGLILERIPYADMLVPEWVIALLFAGIGIYHPGHLSLDARYMEVVLDMAAKGQLAYLIADDNISYGANYPFYHVMIDDGIAKKRSMRTIFQLMGRAGRVGKSWTAKVHLVGRHLENKINSYAHGEYLDEVSEEAVNLNDIVKEL